MPGPEAKAASRAYRDANDAALSERRNYYARRSQPGTRIAGIARARSDWGLAEVTKIEALFALATAEDAELLRQVG